MMRTISLMLGISFLILVVSCSWFQDNSDDFSGLTSPPDWLIPSSQVFDGGPGRDGIPALENPEMINPAFATYLNPPDLVIGIKMGTDIRAYPHKILDYHEIINDQVDNDIINGQLSIKDLAITYCPLTGSAIAWGREFNGQTTTFGVSGLLFQTNLMPFDRLTQSIWSQMRLDCVNGNLIGTRAETYQVVETRWDTWLKMYPGTTVASTNTGFNRNYLQFPYIQGGQDYRTSNSFFLFPFSPMDSRLPSKDRVLGVIINNLAKIYPIQSLDDDVTVIEDEFEGFDLVVVGSRSENFIVAYENRTEDGTRVPFSAVQGELPVVMSDNEGNKWNIFGEAVAGPRVGQRLGPTQSLIGYWFTFGSFYPDAEIYNQ